MISLTTRQRDLLYLLLRTDYPIVVADVAAQLQLTARQVNYSLKGVRSWLDERQTDLKITPGVGVHLSCTQSKRELLIDELTNDANFQLVLMVGQRQQLLVFSLLSETEPQILYRLQQLMGVSRSTILKDLETAANWLQKYQLKINRRPNYGVWIEGREIDIRQALSALLWGDCPFDEPLWYMNHTHGLKFTLANDAQLLPILSDVNFFVNNLQVTAMMNEVAAAEANLGGRFTDHEVLRLALILAIQRQRLSGGQVVNIRHDWYPNQKIWSVAENVLNAVLNSLSLDSNISEIQFDNELAYIIMHLLSGVKNDRWPGDLEVDSGYTSLIDKLLHIISDAYGMSDLQTDATLRDGLIANVIPACLCQKYGLWSPPPKHDTSLAPQKYAAENRVAQKLAAEIKQQTGITLPEHEVNNLALLQRAAYVRERPHRLQEVLVVCPSGMATAQLLMARLKARFPRLGNLTVVSMREITSQKLDEVDLIITTFPLRGHEASTKIIQVHPLLLPEDIAEITNWLA